ncbi:NUDIX hydrolase [Rubrobacter aplysinae]|uniref:NUDIX hydrolase n=1 Tax=Rubrobacter aplysinae TaxID=909625 RepID=UPI00069D80FA|nr:CoA pyrophosphatase [Rubrobacter aplysinae]
MTQPDQENDADTAPNGSPGGFESRLRAATATPFEGWREVYESFSPVDLETGHRRPRTPPPNNGSRRAAVLIPVIPHAGGAHVLYTLRKGHLQDHAGQISFPGGGMEPSDGSLLETALRETREEVGLPRAEIEILGQLEEMYIPPSDYRVSPFVGLLPTRAELALAPEEVEEIFTVPLADLMSGSAFQRVPWSRDGRRYEVPVFAVDGVTVGGGGTLRRYEIWGATAAMTAGLLCRLGWSPG